MCVKLQFHSRFPASSLFRESSVEPGVFTHCEAPEREKSISTLTCFLSWAERNSWPNSLIHILKKKAITDKTPNSLVHLYIYCVYDNLRKRMLKPESSWGSSVSCYVISGLVCHFTWCYHSTQPIHIYYKREGSLKCNTGSTGRGRFPHFNGPFFFFFAGDYTHATARGQSSVIKRRYTTMAIRRSVIYYLTALLGERSRLREIPGLIQYRVLLALCHPINNHFVLL
jgi:hypothetical protein